MTGESLRGYLLQLSESNGLLPEIDLYSLIAARQGISASQQLEAVAARCGIEVQQLPAAWQEASEFPGGAHGIPSCAAWIRTDNCAVCPACISSNMRVPAHWELTHVCACPDHWCHLVDTCQGCGHQLKWRRNGVGKCHCGFDLGRSITALAPAPVVQLAALVRDRLRGHLSTPPIPSVRFPKWFADLSLQEMLPVVDFLSRLALDKATPMQSSLGASSGVLRTQARGATAAANILAAWPGGFQEALLDLVRHQVGEECGEVDLAGLHEAKCLSWVRQGQGRLPTAMRRQVDEFHRRRLKRIARRLFVLTQLVIPLSADPDYVLFRFRERWSGNVVISRNYRLSTAGTAAVLGTSVQTLEILVKVGVLSRAYGPFSAHEVAQALAQLKMPLKELEPFKHLGLARLIEVAGDQAIRLEQLLTAVYSGRLEAYGSIQITMMGLAGIWLEGAEACRLLDRVEEGAATCYSSVHDRCQVSSDWDSFSVQRAPTASIALAHSQ